jgi:hypothetical protein
MRRNIRAKILNMTKQYHNIRSIYKETLRALINSMGGFEYLDQEEKRVKIKCFHGNPERAVAKRSETRNIILPSITVAQINTANSDNRGRYSSVLVHEKFWDDDKQRAIRVLSLAPRPIDIMYEVSIWSKFIHDMDQIVEQVRLLFNPSMEVETSESTLTKAFIEDEANESTFETGDGSDRIVRRTLTIRVETWVTNPRFMVTSTGEIEQLNLNTCIYTR